MCRQKGSALLIVLLMMALIVTVTVLSNEYWQQVLLRSQSSIETVKMKWLLRGNESILLGRLGKQRDVPQGIQRVLLDDTEIGYEVRDAGNCFNLNSLATQRQSDNRKPSRKKAKRNDQQTAIAEPESEEVVRDSKATPEKVDNKVINDYTFAVFSQLLINVTGMGSDRAEAIKQAVAMRIRSAEKKAIANSSDKEAQKQPEDDTPNARVQQPGSPAGDVKARGQSDDRLPFLDSSELRTLAGMDRKTWQQVKSWMCVRPENSLAININTLSPDKGPLLASLFLEHMNVTTASRLLSQRPAGGWKNKSEWVKGFKIEDDTLNKNVAKAMVIESHYFSLSQWVRKEEEDYSLRTLYKKNKNKVKVVERRYGISNPY